MITLNKVSRSYIINFFKYDETYIIHFQCIGWKMFEEDFCQSSWNPEILLKVFAYYSQFMFIFFNFRGMCNFRRNNEKTSHTVKMEIREKTLL